MITIDGLRTAILTVGLVLCYTSINTRRTKSLVPPGKVTSSAPSVPVPLSS
jgi:hypothetical protein